MNLKHLLAALLAAGAFAPTLATACSACGCTLNADWATQGFQGSTGLSLDLRHDYFDQDQLRNGHGRVDMGAISYPNDDEIQRFTRNHITTLTLDWGLSPDWGASVALPYIERSHGTTAAGDTAPSFSRSSGIGGARVTLRYLGFAAQRDWGLQLGLKLPTGTTGVRFQAGPQAGEVLDAGLQPGTGSTDLVVGAFRFGSIGARLDYFVQALAQLPLATHDDFKPARSLNLSVGLRYVGAGPVVPSLQLNVRHEGLESGANADPDNSGSTLAYLSPGATWTLAESVQAYGFVQLPVYQQVRGLQLEPRWSLSVGLRYGF